MTAPAASAHAASIDFSPRRRRMAFAVVAMAFVLNLLDVTIVNIALPSIQQGLGATAAALQWTVAGYALTFAVLLVTGGRLGDSIGYRRMFLGGVAAFTLTSVLCGLAQTPAQLVAARLLQGASAACMVPQVLALLQVMVAPAERFRMFAVLGLLGGASSALGPVVGGLLIDANPGGMGWRSVFLINLPVGLVSLLAGWWLLPPGRSTEHKPVDLPGSAALLLTTTALMLPLIQGPEANWPSAYFAVLAAAAPLAWGTWRLWQRRQARDGAALVNPALLRVAAFRRGLGSSLALHGIVPAYMLALTFTLQGGLRMGPAHMALLCMPIAAGAALSIALLAQKLVPRLGAALIGVGAAVQALALVLALTALGAMLGRPDAIAMPWPLLLAHGLLGIGIGFIGPALNTATLQGVPLAEAGSASGVYSAVQQLAAALALAAVGGLMAQGSVAGGDAVTRLTDLWRVGALLLALLALGAWAARALRIQQRGG